MELNKALTSSALMSKLRETGLLPQEDLLRVLGTGASILRPTEVAAWLLARALTTSIGSAVDDLTKYSKAREFQAIEIRVLDGVTVEERVELEPHLWLEPLMSLEPTTFRDQSRGYDLLGFERSRAALVRIVAHPLVYYSAKGDSRMPRLDIPEKNLLDDTARLMALCPGLAPVVVASWWEALPEVPTGIGGTSAGSFTLGFESTFRSSALQRAAADLLREALTLMRGCPTELWSTLCVVLDRLGAAKRRPGSVNRAIEAGIAAEALFLRFGGEDQSELSFRLAARAAWLLGKDYATRTAVFDLFRALYEARSKAVHNGKVPSQVRKMDVKNMLDRSCEALEQATLATLRDPTQDLQHIHLGR
jgi:hypothetical protein